MEKQNLINEMARDVAVAYDNAMAKEHLFSDCIIYDITGELIEQDYRKERRGEWVEDFDTFVDDNGYESKPLLVGWMCSLCGKNNFYRSNYCPNCGAKMKGVE